MKTLAELTEDDKLLLAKLGGDARVFSLFQIALTAYTFLPLGMMDLRTGKATRQTIIEIFESFGLRAVNIPWHRFPRRFHRNKPDVWLMKDGADPADDEAFIAEVIAAQSPDPVKKKRVEKRRSA